MSENSIAQTDSTQPERWWFTFGSGQTHPITGEDLMLACVVLEGTYEETRAAMLASPFGNRWAFQYSSADKAGFKRYGLRQVEMPESKIWACPENCGYYIADGPTADGELSTDELISEHMEEHAPVDPWVLVGPTPAEPVDELVPEPETERAAYTRGLREIADWLDAHPEVELPHLGNGGLPGDIPAVSIYVFTWDGDVRGQMATVLRAMGRADKVVTDVGPKGRMNLVRQFGGIRVVASADRDEVCRRVVVGSHEVEVEVPDPSVVATVPLVKVKQVVEEVRWECPPLLAEPAPVAAAIVTAEAAELPAEVAF